MHALFDPFGCVWLRYLVHASEYGEGVRCLCDDTFMKMVFVVEVFFSISLASHAGQIENHSANGAFLSGPNESETFGNHNQVAFKCFHLNTASKTLITPPPSHIHGYHIQAQ